MRSTLVLGCFYPDVGCSIREEKQRKVKRKKKKDYFCKKRIKILWAAKCQQEVDREEEGRKLRRTVKKRRKSDENEKNDNFCKNGKNPLGRKVLREQNICDVTGSAVFEVTGGCFLSVKGKRRSGGAWEKIGRVKN